MISHCLQQAISKDIVSHSEHWICYLVNKLYPNVSEQVLWNMFFLIHKILKTRFTLDLENLPNTIVCALLLSMKLDIDFIGTLNFRFHKLTLIPLPLLNQLELFYLRLLDFAPWSMKRTIDLSQVSTNSFVEKCILTHDQHQKEIVAIIRKHLPIYDGTPVLDPLKKKIRV